MDNLCARSISRLDRDFMPGRQVVTGGAKRPYAAHPSTYLDTGRLNERRVILIEELHRVGQGETAALKTVYDMTSAKLFGICLSVCGDSERTEDVLQEIYLAVWIAAKNFDSTRSSPITWLSQIARNKAIDEWRKNRRAPNQVSLSHADHIADAQPDAEWGFCQSKSPPVMAN